MASASSSVVAGDEKSTTEKHRILAHGRTYIDVVYNNEAATVDGVLRMYEGWLDEDEDRFKFVGLDLEYDSSGHKLAVMQIAMREHVLVFHYIRYGFIILCLREYLKCPYIFRPINICHGCAAVHYSTY